MYRKRFQESAGVQADISLGETSRVVGAIALTKNSDAQPSQKRSMYPLLRLQPNCQVGGIRKI